MIYGPQFSQNVNRIQPIDADRHEGDERENRRRKVLYQGRAWAESEEDLPVQPKLNQPISQLSIKRSSTAMYADRFLLGKAQVMFHHLTTLEEKAAQLCFLTTSAIYDASLQNEVELMIQTWQVGGILFHKGEYRRQTYLVERYQAVSKTPLLMANDFLHGLSFYLQGDSLPQEHLSEQRFSDLGKAVMVQNRRLGVHIQFDRERGSHILPMNEEQAKAFRKGIRGAQGIVGKEKTEFQLEGYYSKRGRLPFVSLKQTSMMPEIFSEHQVQETVGFKTLTFFDVTDLKENNFSREFLEDQILSAFKQCYDVLLFSAGLPEAIRTIAKLVRCGKISEEILDRHVMKALIVKSLFF